MAKDKHPARPSLRLWSAVRLWAILFMAGAVASMIAYGYRVSILGQIPPDAFMTEMSVLSDYVAGAEAEVWITSLAALLYVVAYIVCAVLVLMWFLRSIRNARFLTNGVETSPAWVVWWFLLPLVSLWKPYSMASELWRSSENPDRWKGAPDPMLLRLWWGAVLLGGFVIFFSTMMSRTANSAGQLLGSDSVLIVGYGLQIVAGILFLKIGGPISRRQTALIEQGLTARKSTGPTWAD